MPVYAPPTTSTHCGKCGLAAPWLRNRLVPDIRVEISAPRSRLIDPGDGVQLRATGGGIGLRARVQVRPSVQQLHTACPQQHLSALGDLPRHLSGQPRRLHQTHGMSGVDGS